MKHLSINRAVVFFSFNLFLFSNHFFAVASDDNGAGKEMGAMKLNPRTEIILSEKESQRVLAQCSRQTPQAERFWQPTQMDVDKFNQQIVSFFKNSQGRKPTRPLDEYNRQYIGFWSHNKKYIYANFFNRAYGEELRMPISQAVSVCSGGDYFFGMAYDVKGDVIEELRYNADAL